MKFWEELKKRIEANSELLRSTRKVYQFLKTLFKEGSFEVITPFQYKNQELVYRTVIHADADMFNYLPPFPKKAKELPAYLKTSKAAYQKHQKNVAEVFALFDNNKKFWEKLVDYSLVFINVGPAAYSIDQTTVETVLYSVGSIAVSILIRPWLKNKAVSLALKLAVRIVKRYAKI